MTSVRNNHPCIVTLHVLLLLLMLQGTQLMTPMNPKSIPCFNATCTNGTCLGTGAQDGCTCNTTCIYGILNCDTGPDSGSCACMPGFTGADCSEDLDECGFGHLPCRHRGQCHNSIGSFICECLRGWKDDHCQSSNGSGDHDCMPGWTGPKCDDDIDECQHLENPCADGICMNTEGGFTCQSQTGPNIGAIVGGIVGGVVVVSAVVGTFLVYFVKFKTRLKVGNVPDDVKADEEDRTVPEDDSGTGNKVEAQTSKAKE